MNNTEYQTIFASTPDKREWVEYTVAIKRTTKLSKPFKLNATLAWRSHSKVSSVAGVGGSFPSEQAALERVRDVAVENGRSIVRVTRKELRVLEKDFGYPTGRSTYLLSEPVL